MRIALRSLALAALFTILTAQAWAATLERSRIYPHFSNNQTGPVNFSWVAPVPGEVIITRYSGGQTSRPSQQVVYSGPAPNSLVLQGNGTYAGGRYTIRAGGNADFRVIVSGPGVVNF